jgi:hypothetical protein
MIRARRFFGPPPREPRNDPSADQTPEQITAYYRNAQIGDAAAIRQTQYDNLNFKVTRIEDVNRKSGRVYLSAEADWGGVAFFVKSGKNCSSPTGQSRLVIPKPEISAWVKQYPYGTRDWA